MNVLFLTIGSMKNIEGASIYASLLREFRNQGHNVYLVCPYQKREGKNTEYVEEKGVHALRVKIGNITKCGLIEKGVSTILIEGQYKKAIKKYFSNIKFDLVMYTTPPITFEKVIRFIKKRDGAKTYLLLKDIFPQNAVDIGMMKKNGVKGIIYKYFRKKEKKLYAISDLIGCMSQANVDYVLNHNPEIDKSKVEICPNSIEFEDKSVNVEQKFALREKYGIPQDKKVFVYGGNLGKPQGIPFLMECLNAERDNEQAFFLIVGDGTEFNKIKNFIDENQFSNVKLMSKLPREDYDNMVASCDVGMIFLDHRFTIPNFPSRLLSYIQAGLPVLACTDPNTDIGKVIVDGGFGWWCESNDVLAFSELVDNACKADLNEMGKKGTQYLLDNYTSAKGYEIITSSVNK